MDSPFSLRRQDSSANVGFYIHHDDEYEWPRALLTVQKIQQLLAKEYKGGRIVSDFFCRKPYVP